MPVTDGADAPTAGTGALANGALSVSIFAIGGVGSLVGAASATDGVSTLLSAAGTKAALASTGGVTAAAAVAASLTVAELGGKSFIVIKYPILAMSGEHLQERRVPRRSAPDRRGH